MNKLEQSNKYFMDHFNFRSFINDLKINEMAVRRMEGNVRWDDKMRLCVDKALKSAGPNLDDEKKLGIISKLMEKRYDFTSDASEPIDKEETINIRFKYTNKETGKSSMITIPVITNLYRGTLAEQLSEYYHLPSVKMKHPHPNWQAQEYLDWMNSNYDESLRGGFYQSSALKSKRLEKDTPDDNDEVKIKDKATKIQVNKEDHSESIRSAIVSGLVTAEVFRGIELDYNDNQYLNYFKKEFGLQTEAKSYKQYYTDRDSVDSKLAKKLSQRYSGEIVNNSSIKDKDVADWTVDGKTYKNVPIFGPALQKKINRLSNQGVNFIDKPLSIQSAKGWIQKGKYFPASKAKKGRSKYDLDENDTFENYKEFEKKQFDYKSGNGPPPSDDHSKIEWFQIISKDAREAAVRTVTSWMARDSRINKGNVDDFVSTGIQFLMKDSIVGDEQYVNKKFRVEMASKAINNAISTQLNNNDLETGSASGDEKSAKDHALDNYTGNTEDPADIDKEKPEDALGDIPDMEDINDGLNDPSIRLTGDKIAAARDTLVNAGLLKIGQLLGKVQVDKEILDSVAKKLAVAIYLYMDNNYDKFTGKGKVPNRSALTIMRNNIIDDMKDELNNYAKNQEKPEAPIPPKPTPIIAPINKPKGVSGMKISANQPKPSEVGKTPSLFDHFRLEFEKNN